MTSLTHLDLHSNQIKGTIPSEIYNLKNLMTLHLGSNNLSGPISSKIEKLKNLVSLHLSHNLLIGPLPHSLGCQTKLTHLFLHSNEINGSINDKIYHNNWRFESFDAFMYWDRRELGKISWFWKWEKAVLLVAKLLCICKGNVRHSLMFEN